jgi:hypothetical protein
MATKSVTKGVATTFKRRVFVNREAIGTFEFEKGQNADQVIREQLTKKYGADAASRMSVVVARPLEEGSTMPEKFKTAPSVGGGKKRSPKAKPEIDAPKDAVDAATADAEKALAEATGDMEDTDEKLASR